MPAFVKVPDDRVVMDTSNFSLLGAFFGFSIVFAPLGFFVVVSHGIWTLNVKFNEFQRKIYDLGALHQQNGVKSNEFKPRKLIGFN